MPEQYVMEAETEDSSHLAGKIMLSIASDCMVTTERLAGEECLSPNLTNTRVIVAHPNKATEAWRIAHIGILSAVVVATSSTACLLEHKMLLAIFHSLLRIRQYYNRPTVHWQLQHSTAHHTNHVRISAWHPSWELLLCSSAVRP